MECLPPCVKFSFGVDLQRFEVNQTLFGESVLMFNNLANDPSCMREAITFEMLRHYVPVPVQLMPICI